MPSSDVRPRAQRYALSMPILFRQAPGTDWLPGSTVNLSRTGVLFRTENALPIPERPVEFIVSLPLLASAPGGRVLCVGSVARIAPGAPAEGGRAVGVTIDSYEFLGAGSDAQ